MMLVVFGIFFWILVPLVSMVLEAKAVAIYKENAIIASELATMDLLTELDPIALSEGRLKWPPATHLFFEEAFNQKMQADGKMKALMIHIDEASKHLVMMIQFLLPYEGKFINGQYDIPVVFKYEMPINR